MDKTIKEQVREFSEIHKNEIFTTDEIKKELNNKYSTPFNSIIPTDYCYNCTNAGINFDLNTRFFEKLKSGSFKSLGHNYPYTGYVFNKKEIFGTWENGKFTLKNNAASSVLPNLLKLYSEYKNSPEYTEGYKWNFAEKYKGQFRNSYDLIKKLSNVEALNFQSFFMRNSGIRYMVKFEPEALISAFLALFNINNTLSVRIEKFRTIIEEALLNASEWKNKQLADPGVDTASFFLFADDYTSYLLFTKMKPFNNFAKNLKMGNLLNFNSQEERYIAWQTYCLNELIPIMDKYFNKKNTLLDAQDFIWFVGNMNTSENEILDSSTTTKYWMIAAGRNGEKWDDFKNNSIIAIGWDELNNLSKYETREDINRK